MPKVKQEQFCRRLDMGISNIDSAIMNFREARDRAPTTAIRRRLNRNIRLLRVVRADKRQLRSQRCM